MRRGRRAVRRRSRPRPTTAARRPAAREEVPLPAEGRRAPRTLRPLPPQARLPSCPGRGGAGRDRRLLSARAQRRVSWRPAPPPSPRALASSPHPPCESRQRRRLPRLESACWRSAEEEGGGRRERTGRAGRKAQAPVRPSTQDEDRTAARGATGLGPLRAEGGGEAGSPPRPGGSPRPPRSAPWTRG